MSDAEYKLSGHACARCGQFLGSEFCGPSYHTKCKVLNDAELQVLVEEMQHSNSNGA